MSGEEIYDRPVQRKEPILNQDFEENCIGYFSSLGDETKVSQVVESLKYAETKNGEQYEGAAEVLPEIAALGGLVSNEERIELVTILNMTAIGGTTIKDLRESSVEQIRSRAQKIGRRGMSEKRAYFISKIIEKPEKN